MLYILVRHKVSNYETWEEVHDDNSAARAQAGLCELYRLRDNADQNEVVLLFKADDEAVARRYVRSPELKEKMRLAGVQGKPDILFLSEG